MLRKFAAASRLCLAMSAALTFAGGASAQASGAPTTPAQAMKPAAPAQAQAQQTPHAKGSHAPPTAEDAARQLAMLTTQLNLSPEQAGKIKPILVDRNAKLAAIDAKHAGEPSSGRHDPRRHEAHDVNVQADKDIRKVLTPEQQASYQNVAQQRYFAEMRKRLHPATGTTAPTTSSATGASAQPGNGGGGAATKPAN